jgi:hypothetical protein
MGSGRDAPVRRDGLRIWRGVPLHLWITGLAAIAWTGALLVVIFAVSPATHAQALHAAFQPPLAATAQPTHGTLSQPTVGVSTPIVPATNSSLGSNGLAIATILGCVSGVLGLVIGSVALRALVRGGYGPFLRTLLPGAKRRMARDRRNTSRSNRQTLRPSDSRSARNGRGPTGPPPRRTGAPRSRPAGPPRR